MEEDCAQSLLSQLPIGICILRFARHEGSAIEVMGVCPIRGYMEDALLQVCPHQINKLPPCAIVKAWGWVTSSLPVFVHAEDHASHAQRIFDNIRRSDHGRECQIYILKTTNLAVL